MRHFKNALPAPFPLNRYEILPRGDDTYIVWDNELRRSVGDPCCWDDAHTIAEHMERIDVRSQRQIEDEAAGLYDPFDLVNCERDRSHLVTSTRGHAYHRDGGV